MIKVLHPGIYSSIQDSGRNGFSKFGVPVSGAMDFYSHQIGNILLKNRKDSASIEITFGKAKFLFEKDTFICLSGANFSPSIDDSPIEMKTVYEVSSGSILSFGERKYGVRTFLAVQGGFLTETVLKSKSFFSNITSKNRLEKGDLLPFSIKKPYENRGFSKMKVLEELFNSIQLDCFPGPEFYLLNSNEKERLFQEFTVSKDNNRVSYNLEEVLENKLPPIITSSVLPGTVQLTPSGQLIVLMKDCQVTGGYPRILQLSEFSIAVLSQKMAGEKLAFSITS